MAFKLIVIFILLYFIARAIGNMVQSILKDPKATPPPVAPPPRPDRTATWQRPDARQPLHGQPDIEDAKWVDLD